MRNQTKNDLHHIIMWLEKRNRELHVENQKISSALFKVLETRTKLKEQCQAEVEADMLKLERECEDRMVEYQNDLDRDRERMLNALGIDEMEWERISWKY